MIVKFNHFTALFILAVTLIKMWCLMLRGPEELKMEMCSGEGCPKAFLINGRHEPV